MPPLERVLIDYDLNLLRLIAELWGLELSAPNQREAAGQLAQALLDPVHVAAIVEALPAEARAALEAVRGAGGRLPRAHFTRAHGEVRAMGPARRDREQPWHNAPSPAEVLWYRALTAHGFFESESGPQEFTFIPEDLLKRLPAPPPPPPPPPPGHPVEAPAHFAPAAPYLADDVTTLLAYAQIVPLKLEGGTLTTKQPAAVRRFLHVPEAIDLCFQLCLQLKLLSGSPLKPDSAAARPFLELAHLAQTRTLAEAWRASHDWNDLRRLPGLTFEGQAWRNDPVAAREAILKLLAGVPPGEWWSLESFGDAVKTRAPDFQRPAGDYDSWYIRDAETEEYLRGFAHWDRVDGALVRWFIQGPLHWLGLVEVSLPSPPTPRPKRKEPGSAAPRPGTKATSVETAFRLTSAGVAFLGRGEWLAVSEPAAPTHVHIGLDGVVRVPAAITPYNRFRIARVTKWLGLEAGTYSYRLTPTALRRAARQGVELGRIIDFLREVADEHGLPPSLLGALQRWARAGSEAAIQDLSVLRLKSPELLEALQHTPKVQELLGQPLGPAVVEVRRDHVERLRAALAELGILSD